MNLLSSREVTLVSSPLKKKMLNTVFVFQLKLSFTLDKDTMMPQGCYVYQYRDSNK